MEDRELGLVEIYERIKARKTVLGVSFKRSPTTPVTEDLLPCVFMIEGVDEVIKPTARDILGYPAQRALEVTLEIISNASTDIKLLYRRVRAAVLMDGAKVADTAFIHEVRTEGPTGYGLPGVLGMRLVLTLTYTDKGFQHIVL